MIQKGIVTTNQKETILIESIFLLYNMVKVVIILNLLEIITTTIWSIFRGIFFPTVISYGFMYAFFSGICECFYFSGDIFFCLFWFFFLLEFFLFFFSYQQSYIIIIFLLSLNYIVVFSIIFIYSWKYFIHLTPFI